jgi:ATPase subunit of ABC transporter with duplicated ATPase domains
MLPAHLALHTDASVPLRVCVWTPFQALCKGFGDKLLLDDVNFIIPPGALVGIVGGNGAGKTTLFRMIMGQMEPDSGELKVGDTVAPMYVDQSRDSLSADKSVYEEISEGNDEVVLGSRSINARAYCSWYHPHSNAIETGGGMRSQLLRFRPPFAHKWTALGIRTGLCHIASDFDSLSLSE